MGWFFIYIALHILTIINSLQVQGTHEDENLKSVREIWLSICNSIQRSCSVSVSETKTMDFCSSSSSSDVKMTHGVDLKLQASTKCNETIELYLTKENNLTEPNFTLQESELDPAELRKFFNLAYDQIDAGYFYAHSSSHCFLRVLDGADRIKAACVEPVKEEGNWVKLRKCCPPGTVVELDAKDPKMEGIICVNTTEPESWAPYIYKDVLFNKKLKERSSKNLSIKYENGIPKCHISNLPLSIFTPNERAYAPRRAEIRVTESGQMYVRRSGNHNWDVPKIKEMEIKDICIDGLIESQSGPKFHKSEINQVLIHCNGTIKYKPISDWWYAHVVVRVLVGVILLLVVVVLGLLWESQTIYGWTVTFYSLSMLFYVIFNFVVDNLRVYQKDHGDLVPLKNNFTACFIIGVFSHFFSIARFSWNTIINFDMWSTIIYRLVTVERPKEAKRFRYYIGIGFGIPTFVIAISLIIEFQFGYFDDRVVRPQYGNARCNLDKTAILYYEILLCTILFLTSILITCLTLKFILRFIHKAKKIRHFTERTPRYDMAQLFTKIFFLLAFSRVFEIGGMLWHFLEKKTIWWHVPLFDAFLLIESVGFFWLFVCTPQIRTQLRNKFKRIEGIFQWVEKRKLSTTRL